MSASIRRLLRLFLGLFVISGFATAQEPKVRTSMPGAGDLWVGQRATFVVELLVPGFFSGTPAFDLPDPRGVLVIPEVGSPVVGSKEIDGTSYTVQRHELSFVSRRSGTQTLPAFPIRFQFKRHPLDKEAVSAEIKTIPLQFTTKLPPGAEKLAGVISARNLQVVETWKPEPGPAKAGDAFTRTIIFTAPEVPAMAFPPFPSGEIEGLGIYPQAPEVLDRTVDRVLTGERRDKITYVCQRSGRWVIPAARLTWFDLDSQKLQTIDFPARTLEVAANPAIASSPAITHDAGHAERSLASAVACSLGVCAFALTLWRTRAFWARLFAIYRPVRLGPLNPGH